MIPVGRWRWLLVTSLPIAVVCLLAWRGLCRPVFRSSVIFEWTQAAQPTSDDFKHLESDGIRQKIALYTAQNDIRLQAEPVPGKPHLVRVSAEAPWPGSAYRVAQRAEKCILNESTARQKTEIRQKAAAFEKRAGELALSLETLARDYRAARLSVRPAKVDASMLNQLKEIKFRHKYLAANYPTHTDIPVLARQIEKLEARMRTKSQPNTARLQDIARQITETRMHMALCALHAKELTTYEAKVEASWRVVQTARVPYRLTALHGQRLGAGAAGATFIVCLLVFTGRRQPKRQAIKDGLWRNQSIISLEVLSAEGSQELQESASQGLSDPKSREAACLYAEWLALVKKLYEPAPAPPKDFMKTVEPLLRKTNAFIAEGGDALARHLARTIMPDDLHAHVTHTVLMAVMGGLEAGVSTDHGQALNLAALFHDLAIVPRPASALHEFGSEVGRLSAALVRKIPGIPTAIIAMVEEILVGMDEFKQAIWQNLSTGKNLEPLANLLWHIDRFEKVMQKQKVRIDRRLSHRASATA